MVHARLVLNQQLRTLTPARSMLRAMCISSRASGALGDIRALRAGTLAKPHISDMTALVDGGLALITTPVRYTVALSELDHWAGASLMDANGCVVASVMP